jgi:hypothetical protein
MLYSDIHIHRLRLVRARVPQRLRIGIRFRRKELRVLGVILVRADELARPLPTHLSEPKPEPGSVRDTPSLLATGVRHQNLV